VHQPQLTPGVDSGFSSRYAEIVVTFPACTTATEPYGAMVLAPNPTANSSMATSANETACQGVAIGYDPKAGVLAVSGASRASTALTLPSNQGLALRIYVGGGLIEVVANRRASIPAVASVPSENTNASSVSAFGNSCRGAAFDAWPLGSIWQ
jgi:hypothetical protein